MSLPLGYNDMTVMVQPPTSPNDYVPLIEAATRKKPQHDNPLAKTIIPTHSKTMEESNNKNLGQ